MKVIRLLDSEETGVLSDLLNQRIIRELVLSERSISGLAARLKTPPLKVWRRMQKLESLGLIEVARTQKSGNIETKLYRASATNFIPQQFLEFRPTDPRLRDVFETYSQIQGDMARLVSQENDVPEGVNPVDYSLYSAMKAFAEVCCRAENQETLSEMRRQLNSIRLRPAVSTLRP